MCEDFIKELSSEMGMDIHKFYNNEHNEKIEKIISEVCKTKEELLETYSDLHNVESKTTDVKFTFGKSGAYTCGVFSPLMYYEVVAGNAHKGKCVDRLNEVTSNEYEKCFFVGNKLNYAESYIDGKKTEDIFSLELRTGYWPVFMIRTESLKKLTKRFIRMVLSFHIQRFTDFRVWRNLFNGSDMNMSSRKVGFPNWL